MFATAVQRGCGTRTKGAAYLECGLSPFGRPIEDFLMDPPMEIPPGLDVPTQGIGWIEREGVWHVIDHVGASHYPNVADFVEEVRRFGLSRKIPRTSPFERLTGTSRILLVHSRAIMDEASRSRYRPAWQVGDPVPAPKYDCPKGFVTHQMGGEVMCAGLWWEDVQGGESQGDEGDRRVVRKMPSFSYGAKGPAEGTTEYERGIFGSFPITGIAVVKDPEGGSHVRTHEAASAAHVPVELVEE